jgi:hypothetical protein
MKTKMRMRVRRRIIGKAKHKALSFKNAFGYSSALSNTYSTVHNNTLYYLHKKKKKKMMIETNQQRQSETKKTKVHLLGPHEA